MVNRAKEDLLACRDGRSVYADLHSHVMLSAPKGWYGVTDPRSTYKGYHDFADEIRTRYLSKLRSRHSQISCLQAALEAQIGQGVVYWEASFDYMCAQAAGCSWQELAISFSAVLHRCSTSISVRPELGVAREGLPHIPLVRLEEALDTGFFTGIDIYGDERAAAASASAGFVKAARDRGLRVKIHSGEFISAAEMMREIETLSPDAVQHGIAAASDKFIASEIAARKLPLHLAPASNVALGVAAGLKEYPIRPLIEAGALITINSDDFAVFGMSIADQLAALRDSGLITQAECCTIIRNALGLLPSE